MGLLRVLAAAVLGLVSAAAEGSTAAELSGEHEGSTAEGSTARSFPPTPGWQPVLGDWNLPVLTADNTTWEKTAVQEPQVIYLPELKLMRMWYRGAGWGAPSGLGVADSTDNGKTWAKHKLNPVWGGTRPNKAEAAGQPWVYREAPDKYWLYTTTNGKPPQVHIATSTDGLSWKNCSEGPFVNRSHVPSPRGGSVTGTLFGNRAVWKEAEGRWFMLQECGTSEGVWEIFLFKGKSALEWEVGNGGNPLKTLQRHTRSMFGGCHIATVNGEYAPKNADGLYTIWYHAGANGNLPTDVYHATSPDLLNWTVTPNKPVISHRGTGAGFAYDQVADPSPLVAGANAFIAYDGDDNRAGATAHAAIGMGVASAVVPAETAI
jgi:hypothetical protein